MTIKIIGLDTYITRSHLGNFIIFAACLLHYGWAILLAINPITAIATPVGAIVDQCHGRLGAIIVLMTVSTLALIFIKIRSMRFVTSIIYGLLLFPQFWLLILSSGTGITAVVQGHYFDGTVRPPAFILADQSPIIILCLLYGSAIIKIGHNQIKSPSL